MKLPRTDRQTVSKQAYLGVLVWVARCCIVVKGAWRARVGVIRDAGSKVSIAANRDTNCIQSSWCTRSLPWRPTCVSSAIDLKMYFLVSFD